MFAVPHSDINSLKPSLPHFTSQPYCKKCRSAKVKDGIVNLILRNYLVDQYKSSLNWDQAKWHNVRMHRFWHNFRRLSYLWDTYLKSKMTDSWNLQKYYHVQFKQLFGHKMRVLKIRLASKFVTKARCTSEGMVIIGIKCFPKSFIQHCGSFYGPMIYNNLQL